MKNPPTPKETDIPFEQFRKDFDRYIVKHKDKIMKNAISRERALTYGALILVTPSDIPEYEHFRFDLDFTDI